MLGTRAILMTMVLTSSAPARAADEYDSFAYKVGKEINASRKCRTTDAQSGKQECTYAFKGMRLVLVLDPRLPRGNSFLVESAPSGKDTFLKFGGLHGCATISHYGKSNEIAHVFISPKDGSVYTSWDVAACNPRR
jgi:hypothetical protein